MNKEEILAMEASDSLDDLIKRHVMGWKLKQSGSDPLSAESYWYDGNDLVSSDMESLEFSKDISAAWEVIGEMQVKGFATVLQRQGDYFAPDDLWECQFGHKPMAKDEYAQVAICKAALLAVKEDN